MKSSGGCKRGQSCDYLHNSRREKNKNLDVSSQYKCEGCKNIWEDRICVVEHTIHNMKVFFCLNCDDWIQNKVKVFDDGWTLLDEAGMLRDHI